MASQMAVVTGASMGIGYNLAKVFAENGFDLVIAAHDAELNKAEADFRALGVEVKSVSVDLSTFEGVKQLWSEVESMGRPVDAIAVNAGFGVGRSVCGDGPGQGDLAGADQRGGHGAPDQVRGAAHGEARRGPDPDYVIDCGGDDCTTRGGVCGVEGVRSFVAKSLRAELEDTGVTVTRCSRGGGHELLPPRGDGRHGCGDQGKEGVRAVRRGEAGV